MYGSYILKASKKEYLIMDYVLNNMQLALIF